MITTSQFVSDLVDNLVAQGVPVDDAAQLKTDLEDRVDEWLDHPDAVPASLSQKLAYTVGLFQSDILARYDFWTLGAAGGAYSDGTFDVQLPDGTTVQFPSLAKLTQSMLKGDPGGVTYTFATATADADPGAGKLRLDNATAASVTKAYISTTDTPGAAQAGWLDGLDDSTTDTNRGVLYVQDALSGAVLVLRITGAVVTASGYRKVPVSYLAGALPTNNARVSLLFAPSGAKGGSPLYGAGAPGGGVGQDGDIYINVSNGDFYGPKAAGAWGSATASGFSGFVSAAAASATAAAASATAAAGSAADAATTVAETQGALVVMATSLVETQTIIVNHIAFS